MLLYHNRSILRLILAKQGSVFHRHIVIPGLLIAGVTAFLAHLIEEDNRWAPKIPHHYGIMIIGSIAAFALVYRTNLGWQRYWEAMTQQHFMYSKWSDTYAQFFAFISVSIASAVRKGGIANEEKVQRLTESVDRVERNFSLLSAMAAHRLTHGDNECMEQRAKQGAAWRDRLVLRRELRVSEDICASTAMPTFFAESEEAKHQLPEAKFVGKSSSLATLRSSATMMVNNAWFADFRVVSQPSPEEYQQLQQTKDRVGAVSYWIVHDMAQISEDVIIAPPIQSRMYQELSNGMLGFNNSLKIADVPFPFPYAQLLTWIMILFSCLIPFYVVVFTRSMIMSPIAAFIAFAGMWCINEVAIELENPFGADDNDISCWDFHERFLEGLFEQRAVHTIKIEEEGRTRAAKAEKEEEARVSRERGLDSESSLPDFDGKANPVQVDPIDEVTKPSAAARARTLAVKPADLRGNVNGNGLSAQATQIDIDLQAKPPGSDGANVAARSLFTVGVVTEVYDRRLAEITDRIDRRLAQILRELDSGNSAPGRVCAQGSYQSNQSSAAGMRSGPANIGAPSRRQGLPGDTSIPIGPRSSDESYDILERSKENNSQGGPRKEIV